MLLRSRRIVSQYSSLLRNQSMFCAQKKKLQLQILEHKAYLSSQIIFKISRINLDQVYGFRAKKKQVQSQVILNEVRKQSLAKSIVQMIRAEKASKKLNDQATNYMESFFTTGVSFDQAVFNQARMKQSAKKEKPNVLVKIKNQQKRIRFLPTYTVTSFAFNQIIYDNSQSKIFTGHYGISKSISMMLYAMLSGIIAQYKFKTFEKKYPLNHLSRQIRKFPKLLYCNYEEPTIQLNKNFAKSNQNQNGLFADVQKKFFRQCRSEVSKKNQVDYFFIKRLGKKLSIQEYYMEKQIEVVTLFDQFNQFMKLCRRKNFLKNKIQRTEIEETQFQQIQKKIMEFKKMVIQNRKHVGQANFLSSVSYQRILLDELKLGPQGDHTAITQIKFHYLDKIPQEISTYQLIDTLMFLIQQQLNLHFPTEIINQTTNTQKDNTQLNPSQNKQTKQQTQIKQSVDIYSHLRTFLVNELNQYNGMHALTFLTMRSAIKKKCVNLMEKFEYAIEKKQLAELQNLSKELLQYVIKASLDEIKAKFQKFVSKQRDLPQEDFHRIQACLYFSACKVLQNDLENTVRKTELNLSKQLLTDSARKKMIELIDHHLVQYQNQKKLYTLIPPFLLVQIMDKTIFKSFDYLVRNKLLDFSKLSDSSALGKLIEKAFIEMLGKEKVNLKITYNHKEKQQLRLLLQNNYLKQNSFKQIPKWYILDAKKGAILAKKEAQQKKSQEPFEKQKGKTKTKKQQLTRAEIIQLKRNEIQDIKAKIDKAPVKKRQQKQQNKNKFPYNFTGQFRNFLESEIQSIQKDQQRKLFTNSTYLFVPQTKQQGKKMNSSKIATLKSTGNMFAIALGNNSTSKCVDLILINLDMYSETPAITFNVIDVTISPQLTLNKIKKFVQDFCCFEDRKLDKFSLLVSKKQTAVRVQLNYFVLAPGNYQNELTEQLNKDFGKFLKFTALSESQDLCSKVESKQGVDSKCLLKKVGFLKMGQNLIVQPKNPQNKLDPNSPYRTWKEIQRQWVEYEKLLKEQTINKQ